MDDLAGRALLQLRDESGKEISPGAFLPAAERYGLANRLDRWVVETAFDWLDRYRGRLPALEACSINLSGHSLGDPAFLDFVCASLDEFRLPPELICFEITETATIGNLPGATRFLGTLGGRGCRFALDDFGSGLSSFAYLKTLPVQYLKIDGAFVRGIARDPIDLAMVRSINDVGRVMGKHTIAEFVDSEAVLRKLREIGVDYAQGHYVGKPRPLAHLEN